MYVCICIYINCNKKEKDGVKSWAGLIAFTQFCFRTHFLMIYRTDLTCRSEKRN